MRWLWGALAAGALSLSGCGSGGAGSSAFVDGDSGTPAFDATAVGNLIPDATVSNPDAGACTPRTCTQAGAKSGCVASVFPKSATLLIFVLMTPSNAKSPFTGASVVSVCVW